MTSNETWRRYLEAGAAVGQLTAARAEEIARGLIAPDEDERRRARRDVDRLARFGLVVGEQLVDLARLELARQLKGRSTESVERLLARLAEVVGGESQDDLSDDYPSATEPAHAPLSDVPPSGIPGGGAAPARPTLHAEPRGTANPKAPAKPKRHKKNEKERGKNTKTKEKKQSKRKKENQEKEPARPRGGGDSSRVLTLAKPPGSAPTS